MGKSDRGSGLKSGELTKLSCHGGEFKVPLDWAETAKKKVCEKKRIEVVVVVVFSLLSNPRHDLQKMII